MAIWLVLAALVFVFLLELDVGVENLVSVLMYSVDVYINNNVLVFVLVLIFVLMLIFKFRC